MEDLARLTETLVEKSGELRFCQERLSPKEVYASAAAPVLTFLLGLTAGFCWASGSCRRRDVRPSERGSPRVEEEGLWKTLRVGEYFLAYSPMT